MERKEYDSAISLYNEALKHADNDTLRSSIMGYIGDIEHARDDMKRCYKAYNKALKYFADNSSVLNNYAYFLSLEERDLERALEMISRALECSQNNSTYLDTMAWVLYKLGRYTEAKKYMQQALSLDRSRGADYALHYGDILHALGEEFMAKTYWRKALERGADKEEIERRFMPKAEESQPKRVQPKR
jgi:tetratricopeptide (TPR) repeat protein